MATYRVTGPDGATYDVTPPEGTNPSEAEIMAQVQAQSTASSGTPVGADRLREGSSPPFTGLTADPPPENWLAKNYRDYVADPLTRAVETAPGYSIGDLDVRNPNAGEIREAPMVSPETARTLVPQTPGGALATLASLRAGPLGYLANFLYPAAGAAIGSAASGSSAEEVLGDAASHGVGGVVGKGLMDVGTKALQIVPYAKGKIQEYYAKQLAGTLGANDPAVAQTIAGQEVSPLLRGGTTMSQMRQAATGGDIQKAASGTMEAATQQVDALSGQPRYVGPALNEGYDMLDDVVKNHIIGPVGITGYTLQQAQAIRSEIGSAAFSKAAHDRGIGDAALIRLRGKMTDEIESLLTPDALPLWRAANTQYGGSMVGNELLNEPHVKTGLANRMAINRNTISDFFDRNRQDLIARMGKEQFDAIVDRVLGGAQPGTRDVLTSGAGTPLAALMQTLGRGTNTGSMNTLGIPLRTVFPGIGNEWTGRPPFSPDAGIQALMNYLGQTSAEQYRGALGGTPVKIGPLP